MKATCAASVVYSAKLYTRCTFCACQLSSASFRISFEFSGLAAVPSRLAPSAVKSVRPHFSVRVCACGCEWRSTSELIGIEVEKEAARLSRVSTAMKTCKGLRAVFLFKTITRKKVQHRTLTLQRAFG